jgi:hypothetical protein
MPKHHLVFKFAQTWAGSKIRRLSAKIERLEAGVLSPKSVSSKNMRLLKMTGIPCS